MPGVADAAPPPARTLINGDPAGSIDPADRGFTLGDGLFETIAIRRGAARFWRAHCERLGRGCQRLGLAMPAPELLAREIEQVRGTNSAGTVRLTVSRGVGPRGYAPPRQSMPTRVTAFHPGGPPSPGRPLALRWCSTRLGLQPALAGIKHLGRLEQVLARSEWSDDAIDEGVLQSVDGRVIECVAANLFLVRDGVLLTPMLRDCGVAGVVRAQVLTAADELGIETDTRDLGPDEAADADELFITNASRGLAPVGRLGERRFAAPGPIADRLNRYIDWME